MVLLVLAACQTAKPCPECKPLVIHEPSPALPTPIECPAVKVDPPDLVLRPEALPQLEDLVRAAGKQAWEVFGPPIEHDYRELVKYFVDSWPQIVAQHKAPQAPSPAPSPAPPK